MTPERHFAAQASFLFLQFRAAELSVLEHQAYYLFVGFLHAEPRESADHIDGVLDSVLYKAVASEDNTEKESGELELANYTWQYERHVANGQNFGTFFTAIDPPVPMPDNYGDVYGVYCYLWMEDFASMDAMADIIGTLAFREAE